MIKTEPFEVKAANKWYNYSHHLDEEDLFKIQSAFYDIYPYSFEKHKNVNEYIDIMTYHLYKLIVDGKFIQAMKLAREKSYPKENQVVWVGKSPQ